MLGERLFWWHMTNIYVLALIKHRNYWHKLYCGCHRKCHWANEENVTELKFHGKYITEMNIRFINRISKNDLELWQAKENVEWIRAHSKTLDFTEKITQDKDPSVVVVLKSCSKFKRKFD